MVTYSCRTCGGEFVSYPSWQRSRDGHHYCSRACGHAGRTTRQKRKCRWCGEVFTTQPNVPDHGRYRYCSQDCYRTDRFWGLVDKQQDGHWLWRGLHCQAGHYGRFGWKGRIEYCHQVAWLLVKGQRPARYIVKVCHQDGCLNPAHWSDVAKMQRPNAHHPHDHGGGNPCRRLNPEQVAIIWALRRQGASLGAISKAVPVGPTAVWSVLQGRTYRDLSPEAA